MQIVVNEQLKDAIEWTCKYASEYKVDIDIHIDTDGEISVSVCPTYRDRDTADTPQTDCETCKYGQDKHRYEHICNECGVGINNYTPQNERRE